MPAFLFLAYFEIFTSRLFGTITRAGITKAAINPNVKLGEY